MNEWQQGEAGLLEALIHGQECEFRFDSDAVERMRWNAERSCVVTKTDDEDCDDWVPWDSPLADVACWRPRREPRVLAGVASVEPCCDGGSILAVEMPGDVRVGTAFNYTLTEVT